MFHNYISLKFLSTLLNILIFYKDFTWITDNKINVNSNSWIGGVKTGNATFIVSVKRSIRATHQLWDVLCLSRKRGGQVDSAMRLASCPPPLSLLTVTPGTKGIKTIRNTNTKLPDSKIIRCVSTGIDVACHFKYFQ